MIKTDNDNPIHCIALRWHCRDPTPNYETDHDHLIDY